METVTSEKSATRANGAARTKWARNLAGSILLPLLLTLAGSGALTGCDRNAPAALQESKITPVNYDKITLGMSQAQVKDILGEPSSADTKDLVIYKKTTFRYAEGDKFIEVTFKNDELDSKNSNLETK